MNDDHILDPQWQSFEAQLAAQLLQVSPREKDQILYACAFAAGKSTASRTLRIWRTTAAVLSLVLTVSLVPHLHAPPIIVTQTLEVPASSETTPPQSYSGEFAPASQHLLLANLDAWQVPSPDNELLSEQLTEFAQFDPHLRSLTVSSMTRAVLNP
jgi:hypothetical protein